MKWRQVGCLVSFRGRVGRGAFWAIEVGFYAALLVAVAPLVSGGGVLVWLGLAVLGLAYEVGLATSVKRWHDRDKSGWWVLITLVPIVGALWAVIEQGFLRGTAGDNQYGAPGSGAPFGPAGRTTGPARGMRVDTSGLRPGMTDEQVRVAWRTRHGRD